MNPKATNRQAVLVLDDDVRLRDHPYKFPIDTIDQYRAQITYWTIKHHIRLKKLISDEVSIGDFTA